MKKLRIRVEGTQLIAQADNTVPVILTLHDITPDWVTNSRSLLLGDVRALPTTGEISEVGERLSLRLKAGGEAHFIVGNLYRGDTGRLLWRLYCAWHGTMLACPFQVIKANISSLNDKFYVLCDEELVARITGQVAGTFSLGFCAEVKSE